MDRILDLMQDLADAKVAQEELEECGDLEERLEAAEEVASIERRLETLRLKENE